MKTETSESIVGVAHLRRVINARHLSATGYQPRLDEQIGLAQHLGKEWRLMWCEQEYYMTIRLSPQVFRRWVFRRWVFRSYFRIKRTSIRWSSGLEDDVHHLRKQNERGRVDLSCI